MEAQLLRVYEEAHEVRAIIDAELQEYGQEKGKLSLLRQQNLVLWSHIKKLNKKMRRERKRAIRKKEKAKQIAKVRAEAHNHGISLSIDDAL